MPRNHCSGTSWSHICKGAFIAFPFLFTNPFINNRVYYLFLYFLFHWIYEQIIDSYKNLPTNRPRIFLRSIEFMNKLLFGSRITLEHDFRHPQISGEIPSSLVINFLLGTSWGLDFMMKVLYKLYFFDFRIVHFSDWFP